MGMEYRNARSWGWLQFIDCDTLQKMTMKNSTSPYYQSTQSSMKRGSKHCSLGSITMGFKTKDKHKQPKKTSFFVGWRWIWVQSSALKTAAWLVISANPPVFLKKCHICKASKAARTCVEKKTKGASLPGRSPANLSRFWAIGMDDIHNDQL